MSDDTKALVLRLREIYADRGFPSAQRVADTIERLERELAEARRDAARYRWLRDNGDATWIPLAKRYKASAELDRYIDAAIAAQEKEREP